MPIEGLGDVIDRTADLQTRYVAVTEAVSPDLETGTQTDAQVLHLRAELAAVDDDTRDLLDDLDAIDELDFALVPDGRRTILLWKWRRASRKGLLAFAGLVREARRLAAELDTGQQDRVTVSREGDTLQSIAARELGDWREWPRLLRLNPDINPGALESGQTIVLPEKR